MTGAIWALAYEISYENRETYLDWFHQIHIPEKLARPGYSWAAHFKGSATTPNTHSYIALFGGISTRIFLDPSPAQLKTKQDDLTREMMAKRRHPFATILVHEWSDRSTPSTSNDQAMALEPINSDWLDFLVINAVEQGEAIGAWVVQNLLPKLQSDNPDAAQNDAITHKFLSVTGPPVHILFHETNRSRFIDDVINFDLETQILSDGIKKASVRHQSGKRIWPV
jgi:hypothetical protein